MEVSTILDRLANEPIVIPKDDKRQDATVRSKSGDAWKLEGDSSRGEVVEYVSIDETEGTFTHEIMQDVEPILEHAKDLSSLGGKDAGKNKAKDWYLAGTFPVVLVHAWLNRRGLTMKDFKGDVVKDFLNDDSHKAFRIYKGKV